MQFSEVPTDSNETKSGKRGQQRRQYTSSAQQRHYVQLWQQSNESVVSFCKAHDIHPKTFDHWRKKYEVLSLPVSCKSTPLPTTPNDKNEVRLSNENIKLHLPNHICLSLPQAVSAAYLGTLLRALLS